MLGQNLSSGVPDREAFLWTYIVCFRPLVELFVVDNGQVFAHSNSLFSLRIFSDTKSASDAANLTAFLDLSASIFVYTAEIDFLSLWYQNHDTPGAGANTYPAGCAFLFINHWQAIIIHSDGAKWARGGAGTQSQASIAA